jgi:cyanophycinase-like exopeptidase
MTTVCLQGGNELTPDCRPMDRQLLELAPPGPVCIVALASRPGSDYARTTANATSYFTSLGADAVAAPDARRDPDGASDLVAGAAMIVLTGGSPRLLRDSLADSGLGDRIIERATAGALVMGSSAGAMVACETTLLPQWRGDPAIGPGIGLVRGIVVVPHFAGSRPAWVRAALSAGDLRVLGIPECSGVLVSPTGDLKAIGLSASTLITADSRTDLEPA